MFKLQCDHVQSKPSWISSSFDDLQVARDSFNARQRPSTKCTNKKPAGGAHRYSPDCEKLWVNKHSPSCVDDLAVNKKKVACVREVLERSFARSRKPGHSAQIILLTGETGTGKSATLQLLAKELQAEVKEWIFPAADPFVPRELASSDSLPQFESQWSKFYDFLFRANRYSSVERSADCANQRRIIVIEEFSHVFVRNLDAFHSVLRRYHSHGRCPLAFIIGNADGVSPEHLLFPKSLQTELCVETVSLNAAAPTVLSKMLLKIATQEFAANSSSFRMPDADAIEQLVMASHGDIRAAINSLQFYCQTSTNNVSQPTEVQPSAAKRPRERKTKAAKVSAGKSKKPSTTRDSEYSIGGKDSMLTLFHAVGKVLHCKRDCSTSPSEDLLPDHMSNLKRRTLLVDPEGVADSVHLTSEQFVAFLHQNFVDFHTEIDDVSSAAAYISDCETLTNDWTTKSLLHLYAVSVASRGCMFSLPNGPTAVGWKPLHKPQLSDVRQKVNQQTCATQDLFAAYHIPTVILHTELFPYLSICAGRSGMNRVQRELVDTVARLPKNAVPGYTRLERLGERDAVMLDASVADSSELESVTVPAETGSGSAVTDGSSELNAVDYADSDINIEEFDD